jgi:hypothetical protein
MPTSAAQFDAFLEIGKKRIFAGVLDWPGWYGSGRHEASALEALLTAGQLYARVARAARLGLKPPKDVSAFTVIERLTGNATTDFGAPDVAVARDAEPMGADEVRRWQALLQACWSALDATAASAAGRELRKGPRGGGRDLEGIVAHVQGAEQAYLSQLGWKLELNRDATEAEARQRTREAILRALPAAARGELPAVGPRGGARWRPRYFVRRVAWHVLDHITEIEHRLV